MGQIWKKHVSAVKNVNRLDISLILFENGLISVRWILNGLFEKISVSFNVNPIEQKERTVTM